MIFSILVGASLFFQKSIQMTASAEFDRLGAIWIAWPQYDHKKGVSLDQTFTTLVSALTPHVKVRILVPNRAFASELSRKLPASNVEFVEGKYGEIWMRDFGPSFLSNGKSKRIIDFQFNYWGYESISDTNSIAHSSIDREIGSKIGVSLISSQLISEGGNRESNGRGVLMLCQAVEQQRNPNKSLSEIESELKRKLGIKRVIWLPKGLVEDGYAFDGPISNGAYLPITTGGHIDNFARFTDAKTILLAEVTQKEARRSAIAKENRKRLEAAYQILRRSTDQDGQPFRVIRMPAADIQTETMSPGDAVYDYLATLPYSSSAPFPVGKQIKVVHAASYLNFVIANGVVVTSRLYQPGDSVEIKRKDELSIKILKRVFPNRLVKAIDSRSINLGGGGLHCVTAHEPLIK